MIEIISNENSTIGNETISAAERLYFATTLGFSLRSFSDDVLAATVRFEERPSGGFRCSIEVETRMISVESASSASSRASAFLGASEALDRRLFSAIYGPSRQAA